MDKNYQGVNMKTLFGLGIMTIFVVELCALLEGLSAIHWGWGWLPTLLSVLF